jgi:hypothetical protein
MLGDSGTRKRGEHLEDFQQSDIFDFREAIKEACFFKVRTCSQPARFSRRGWLPE